MEGEGARYVHRGATSQDVMDTASMLVARARARARQADLDAAAAACARLADEHRGTLMAGRTLLQQALPTTFGLRAAGWLVALLDAGDRLAGVPLAAELGGAAGTLASLGSDGPRVLAELAAELELEEPAVPWHTARLRVAELGAALALAAGTLEKIALDVTLLAQTEVGELAEPGGEGRGGSSTLPHKRNPVGSVLAIACARRVRGETSILLAAMAQEHERAAGAWQAEWEALGGALAYTGGAAAAVREVVEGLEVRPRPHAREPRRHRRADPGRGGEHGARRARGPRRGARARGRRRARGPRRPGARSGTSCWTMPRSARTSQRRTWTARSTRPATSGAADAFVERALERYRERR